MTDLLVDAGALRGFVSLVLQAISVAPEDADTVADVLVTADLRGHESHGVARLDGFYVRRIHSGQIDPRATTTVLRESAATAVLDAGHGLGHPAGKRAMALCIDKARQAGTCVVTVRRSNHYGIAGYYAMMALPHDMIGVSCTNSLAMLVPTRGRSPALGTNPIALAAPAGRRPPFVLDMATSVVPMGKVEAKARRDEPLPPGWAVDAAGLPARDAQAVLDASDAHQAGGLMPLGGLEAGHKGYGLAAMVDVLCGALAGARAGVAVYGEKYDRGEPADVGHIFAAINLQAFGPVEEFKRSMDDYIDALHATPLADQSLPVLVAGEPEMEHERNRMLHGIPLHDRVAENLRDLARRTGVPVPF